VNGYPANIVSPDFHLACMQPRPNVKAQPSQA
jgi:hypothetical protein